MMWFEIVFVAVFLLIGQFFRSLRSGNGALTYFGQTRACLDSISFDFLFFGRFWFWIAFAATFVLILIVHAWRLPKKGING